MLSKKSPSPLPLCFFAVLSTALLGQVLPVTAQPFASGADITTSADGAWSVYAADIDGDGDQDVLSASRHDATIAWYQNGNASGGGDGSSWTVNHITTIVRGTREVSAADIDGDGDQDVLAAIADATASGDDDSGIAWYRNGDSNGGGDGSSWIRNIPITSSAARSAVAADIDGDGDQDVLAAHPYDDSIAWYRNGDSEGGGDGSSWTRNSISFADGAQAVFAADIDGDGDQDVLSASEDIIAFFRNGDASGGGNGSSWTRTNITTSANGASSVYAADIDGDNDLDVISSSSIYDTVAWHRNGDDSGDGNGSSWTTTDITTSAIGAWCVYAADIDGDGDQDVLSASHSDDTIAWYRNGDSGGGGNGSSWTRNNVTSANDTQDKGARGVYAADIDGDGALDLLSASDDDDSITWYRNKNKTIPVEFARFSVHRQSEKAVLTWKTASEQNNAGFEVQRRVYSGWESISFVEGAGTTSKPQAYRFQDSNLPFDAESVNYRLKQIDTDGSTSLSDTRTLRIGAPDRLILHAPFPNPAPEHITLRYALPRKVEVSIGVYDLLGRRAVAFQRGVEDVGRKEIQIPTSALSPGTYFVRMQAGKKIKTKQLTVVR